MSQFDDKVIGRQLGSYQIIESIGQGGMARVYKGFHEDLNRYAAIKVIIWGLAEDQEFTRRFRREAQAIATLRHNHIVTIYDFGNYDHGYYLVMEYIEGEDLEAQIARGEPPSSAYIQRVMTDVASALDYAHQRRVIHRDVKPSNIMMTREGEAILTDFGLALLPSAMGNTTLGTSMGTPYYMAPEQAASSSAAVPASDIYSLGVILFELITGTPPYVADNPLGVALKHVSDPIPNVQDFVPDIPDGVKAVIEQAMAKSVEDRFETATEMAQALSVAWGETEIKPTPVAPPLPVNIPPPITPPPIRPPLSRPPTAPRQRRSTWPRQPQLLWGLLVGLVLIVLSVGVGLNLRQPNGSVVNFAESIAMAQPGEVTPTVAGGDSDSQDQVQAPDSALNESAPLEAVITNTATSEATMTVEPAIVILETSTATPLPTQEPTEAATVETVLPTSIPQPTNTPTTEELLIALEGKILFKTNRSERVEIYQMNQDGSDQKPLGVDLAYLYNEAVRWEAFSPNRQQAIVVRGEGQVDLWFVDLAEGREYRVTNDGAPDYDPVWSPLENDNRIVFVSERTGRGDLYLLDLDGSGVTRLTSNESDFDKHPSWSADGKKIVYWSDEGWQKKPQIFMLDLETQNKVSLSNNPFQDWDPLLVKIRRGNPSGTTSLPDNGSGE